MMQACSVLANVVMIYEEKRENDGRLDIKALLTLTGTGYITQPRRKTSK